ncbi:MAG: DUF655 domain-containing protein [Conexivisphaerales archaeon]
MLSQQKKYERLVYVLDFRLNAQAKTLKNKNGTILETIGVDYFMLLELLAVPGSSFVIMEKINISKENRSKVLSVLGRLKYDDLSQVAKNILQQAIETIVNDNQKNFVNFFNQSVPITPRLNALELIPGIGKTLMLEIIREKEKRPFTDFKDIQERVGLKDPAKRLTERIMDEIKGNQQIYLFVKQI